MELRTEVTEELSYAAFVWLHYYNYIFLPVLLHPYTYSHTRIPVSAHTAADDMLKSIVNKLVSREGQHLTSGN
jgi:hypothetical protein